MAERIIETKAVISAEDKTGGAFSGLLEKLKNVEAASKKLDGNFGSGIERKLKNIDRLSERLDKNALASRRMIDGLSGFDARVASGRMIDRLSKFTGEADRAAKKIQLLAEAERKLAQAHRAAERAEERRAEGIRHHGVTQYIAGGAAGYVGAHGIVRGIEHTMKAGARYQHETVALQNAGRTPEEMKEIEEASRRTSALLPTATFEENLKVINETTGAFGDLHHAIENLPFMQKSSSVLKAAAGDKISDSPGELGNKLARFFEERQVAGNTEVFQREAEGLVRAMAFTRGNFNPEQALNFAQQAKSALPNFSERYLTKIAPSLITMMGGDRAGTAENAFNSVITGKVNDKKQAEEWLRYGLLDPKQAVMKAGHAVGWRAGAVKGTDLALSDRLRWAEEVALPALKAKGVNVDDRMELTKVLATMFRNSNANMYANAIMQAQSRARLHKDETNIDRAGSLEEIYKRNLAADPTVAMTALTASLDNLMTAASSPAMAAAAKGITFVAESLQSLSGVAKDHPYAAMGAGGALAAGGLAGAGYMSYQLMNGFGLAGSAAALDESAAALTLAAAKLGGGSVVGDVAKKAAGGTALSGLTFGGLAMGVGAALLGASAGSTPNPDPTPEQYAEAKKAYEELKHKEDGETRKKQDFTLGYRGGFNQNPMTEVQPGGIGLVSARTGRKAGGEAPLAHQAPQLVSVNFEPAMLRVEVMASSSLLSVVDKAKSIELKPRSADAPGGNGETTTGQH